MIYSEPLFSKSPQIGNHDGFVGKVPFLRSVTLRETEKAEQRWHLLVHTVPFLTSKHPLLTSGTCIRAI